MTATNAYRDTYPDAYPDAYPRRERDTLVAALIMLTLTAWFMLVNGLGWAGAFQNADRSRPPLGLASALALPLVLFALVWLASARFRRFFLSVDLWTLTLLQTWRVAGVSFLILWAMGRLPASFALPAGLGDVFVGVTAPFVAAFVVPRLPASSRTLVWWSFFGVLDLVVAIVMGVLNSPSQIGLLTNAATLADPLTYPLGMLPMTLIPCFFVPVTLLLHAITLLRLRALGQEADARPPLAEEGGELADGGGVAEVEVAAWSRESQGGLSANG
jgi:hypothetical protein